VTKENRLLLYSALSGVLYGLLVRGIIQATATPALNNTWLWVMSAAFILAVPFSVGYISVAMRARQQPVGFWFSVGSPWVPVALVMLGCELVGWEGTICIVMITPIALLFGSFGGLVARDIVDPSAPKTATMSILLVALLPFLLGAAEHKLPVTEDMRGVESDALIHASPEIVWANIERVRSIEPGELPRSWNRVIGFPRPIEATLSRESVGAVRHATFAGNVLFVETIDEWEPDRRLGFSIHADTKDIPPGTLDDHVTVGGPYFDVLHGEYILGPAGNGVTRLRLISRHRVSTHFNWYAHLWTDAVMRDVQHSILYVIKNRCEASPALTN
jgi:hypothetical protein